ncbi:MAG TPA: hypothetical protein VER03_15455, partial [Bryobacteraceae bacterium]|nr:hypothetical protein [Bryobacteraceae bacterium]
MPKFVRTAILRLLVWVLVSGAGLAFYAYWTRDTTQITSRVVSDVAGEPPEHVWATGMRTFVGYTARSGRLTIWNITASEEKLLSAVRTIETPNAEPGSIALSRDGARAFWLAGGQLVTHDLDYRSTRSTDVGAVERNSILQVSDSHVVLVAPSGETRVFRSGSLAQTAAGEIPVRNADLTEANGPFIAIAERATGSTVVVDTRVSSKVGVTESRNLSTRIAALAITGAGTLAVATESGSIFAKERLGTPGFVRWLRYFDDQSFMVTGEFRGVHLIPRNAPTQQVSAAEPGARAFATTSKYFLLMYPGRMQLHSLGYLAIVRPKVKSMFRVWLGVTLVFLIFTLFRSFGHLFRMLRTLLAHGWGGPRSVRTKTEKLKNVPEIGEPETDLLAAAADRACVVFAGEELSRASSMPTWRTFVLGFIDLLHDSLLLEPEHSNASRAAHRAGQVDHVAKQLEPLALANRELVNEFARGMYCKPAALTRLHEAIASVGACAFITPNLDPLLERCFGLSTAESFAPAHSGDALGALLRRQFVGMKLRGMFERPETLHVWPSEAQAANAKIAEFRRFLAAILTNKTTVFVAASAEEIEAWLAPAELTGRPGRKHYA